MTTHFRLTTLTLILLAFALAGLARVSADDGDETAPPPDPVEPSDSVALPAGDDGLAARYVGDDGIADDEAVLLAESFAEGDVAALAERFTDVKSLNDDRLAFVEDDGPDGAADSRSLRITATLGDDTGGHLYRPFAREVETAFARFYVKFPDGAGYTHHFVHMGGYNPSTRWPQGGAGEQPAGDERITVGIEPHGEWGKAAAPGIWSFYSYWHKMAKSPDGKYWGNVHHPVEPAAVPAGRWQCVEFMIKLNTPGESDGELALWLDGELVMHFAPGALVRAQAGGARHTLVDDENAPRDATTFDGFDWRKTADLNLNFFWLLYYVTENAHRQNRVADPPTVQTVQFDNIVVATEYIGPITPADAGDDDDGNDDDNGDDDNGDDDDGR